jgi:uncharacterized protein YebE (UPF0316 family)
LNVALTRKFHNGVVVPMPMEDKLRLCTVTVSLVFRELVEELNIPRTNVTWRTDPARRGTRVSS